MGPTDALNDVLPENYIAQIDYSLALDFPLQPEDRAWAEQLAATAIARPSS
jgi:hypothetical protein